MLPFSSYFSIFLLFIFSLLYCLLRFPLLSVFSFLFFSLLHSPLFPFLVLIVFILVYLFFFFCFVLFCIFSLPVSFLNLISLLSFSWSFLLFSCLEFLFLVFVSSFVFLLPPDLHFHLVIALPHYFYYHHLSFHVQSAAAADSL